MVKTKVSLRPEPNCKPSKPQPAVRLTPATSYLSYLAAFSVLLDHTTPPSSPRQSMISEDFDNEMGEELMSDLESQMSGLEDMLV